MAVYKVIQDIESEDKIVGFLTLKTFVYALICGALLYINIRFVMANVLGPLRFAFVFILLWPMLLFGILAAPLGREQPTETWILAHVRFFIKPRIRIWNQSGLLDLVTITAPKKFERDLTNNLTQTEVRSRLKALATTMDSRGWAVRNVAINLNANPSYLDVVESESDRLAAGSTLTQNQGVTDVQEADDIMDAQNNPTAQHFETLMQQEDEKRQKKVSAMINTAQQEAKTKSQDEETEPEADYSILDKISQPDKKGTTGFVSHAVITPGAKFDTDGKKPETQDPELAKAEQAYIERERKKSAEVHAKSAGFKPKVQPAQKQEMTPANNPENTAQRQTQPTMTKPAQNANLEELAQSGNDLSVASVQKLANRASENIKQIGPNEVEIDFHSR
jgi:hypothetical protein